MFISSIASVLTSQKTRSIYMTNDCVNAGKFSCEASVVLCVFNQSGCFFRFFWKTQIWSFTVIRALRIRSFHADWQTHIYGETGICFCQIFLADAPEMFSSNHITSYWEADCGHLVTKLAVFKPWVTGLCLLSVARTFMCTSFFFNRHYNPLLGFGLLNYRWAFSAGRFSQSAVASSTSNPTTLRTSD